MKRIISLVLAVALMFVVTACGGASSTKMTMGTGGTSGTYYAYGGVLGQYITDNAGVNVTVVSTDGSKANIQEIDAGNYQLGTVQSDVMAYAWQGSRSFEEEGKIDSFRVVAGLYDLKKDPNNTLNIDEAWNECSYFNKASSRSSANSIIIKLNLLGLTLKETKEGLTKKEYLCYYIS